MNKFIGCIEEYNLIIIIIILKKKKKKKGRKRRGKGFCQTQPFHFHHGLL
jgi:hypothetical protein